MAGRGPAPKTAHHRTRDTRRRVTYAQTTVTDDGEVLGPELADATLRADWAPQTRRWWDTWRGSPQAKVFAATDWDVLARLALLVDRQVIAPTGAIASEIRLVEASLGATVADRQRLRLAIVKPEDAQVLTLLPDNSDVLDRLGTLDVDE